MRKIFVDTDIVYDLLAKREPFFDFAAILFTKADRKQLKLFVSSLTFANLHYLLTKLKNKDEARRILSRFKVLVNILPVDDKTIELALNSEFADFEDAIQYYCAIENKVKTLITRNIKDYKTAKIPVLTAEQYVKQIKK